MIASAAVWCNAGLDGVFERRNDFLEIGRQLASPLDCGPQRDRRRSDESLAEGYRVEIVVKMGSSPTVPRIT